MSPRRALLPVLALFARLAAAQASAPDGYLPSERCVECHADRHASWARTFHRSMTREAGPETVKVHKGDEEKARASGCDGYVTKPYSPMALLRLIRGYLGEKS